MRCDLMLRADHVMLETGGEGQHVALTFMHAVLWE